jgi:hypothetical protein
MREKVTRYIKIKNTKTGKIVRRRITYTLPTSPLDFNNSDIAMLNYGYDLRARARIYSTS